MSDFGAPLTAVVGKSESIIARLPADLRELATKKWLALANVKPKRWDDSPLWQRQFYDVEKADNALRSWVAPFFACADALPLDVEATDEEIRDFAKQTGDLFRSGIYQFGWDWAYLRKRAVALGLDWDVVFDGKSEVGILGRLQDGAFWNRQLGKLIRRSREHVRRAGFNLVNKRGQLFCSNRAVRDRRAQKLRNSALLQALSMVNELGEEFLLAELVEKSNANPAVRRAELMTRIAGFEAIARDLNHAGEFLTLTCPSRFHRAHHISGDVNDKYDGSSPRDAAAYLQKVWAKIQAALKRAEIGIYGFRVAEPHHDGCPHWHGLFFMEPCHVDTFRRIVARYACRENREELGLVYCETQKEAKEFARTLQAKQRLKGDKVQSLATILNGLKVEGTFWEQADWRVFGDAKVRARVLFKAIDWNKGTAAGYIAKYIAKNIDGKNNAGDGVGEDWESADGGSVVVTAERVDAWAALWGIRQFQQIGGAPVGIWRELRRDGMTDGDADNVIVRAALAADKGDWGKFVHLMGGAFVFRDALPIALYKEEAQIDLTNRYGEPVGKFTRGVVDVASGEIRISRIHEWVVGFKNGGTAAPWTCVNNSTNLQVEPMGVDCVKKRKDAVDISALGGDYRDELKRQLSVLARDMELDPFVKNQEMALIEQALWQTRQEPVISPETREMLVVRAVDEAWAQREHEVYRGVVHDYVALLDDLADAMQPRFRQPENRVKASELCPGKLRRFPEPKHYDSAYSVLAEAADLLAEIEQDY
ncbi:replication endonuclease [Kingella sp. (in: b-proteobacteria)]|uniref:replication endonuclease n=1 Tax=Kingella sp. (in: b-proteobacteria) TaxID=2020713 RepID=UPI0026DD29FA|nr:replication endonuclease [Kingella sp. (in: b-proteobacteria)]MDO4657060.1 replication endonuclease [Kingella sp. (in: b-proteobacteria)]